MSVEGSVIVERQDANALAYKSPVTAKLLLGGTVEPPYWATPLIKTLEACTGMPGNREWINDEGSRSPGTYVFGGVSSPGPMSRAPSFLRKKKKSEIPSFPPESWGEETRGRSYFNPPVPQSHSRNLTWDGSVPSSGSFHTRFESDFSPDRHVTLVGSSKLSTPSNSNQKTSNSFISPGSSLKKFDHATGIEDTPFPLNGHQRTTSLGNQYKWDPWEDSLYLSSTLPQGKPLPSDIPFIKSRRGLEKPLSPHEGVARAIALFDFNAVEVCDLQCLCRFHVSYFTGFKSGDLSFRRGDIIIVTKKSDSVDDW